MVASWLKPKTRVDASVTADGGASDGKPLILVVEDHDDTRFMLSYLMEMHGYRVVEATDGEEAVRLAEAEHPDLILMDTSLPRLDGLQATRRIREHAALHDVPVVFLSGHAQPNKRAEAIATGGTEYLVKPLELSELERTVERFLGESHNLNAR
jgi:CheY-like chemotaxis protein